MRPLLLCAAKGAAWTNRPHFLNRNAYDGSIEFSTHYDATRIVLQVDPLQGAMMLYLATSEHYYDSEVAAKSCCDVSESLGVPLRLWQDDVHQGRFFVHASLDLSQLGCTAVASHHPITA